MNDPLDRDLDEILETSASDFAQFRGARLLITGGTGFVGTWFVRSIVHANRHLGLGISADVLTRDPDAFRRERPEAALARGIGLVVGDVTRPFASAGGYDAIVHAATPASAALNERAPGEMLDVIVDGGRRVVDLAERCGNVPVLFASSGAVYGRQPPDLAAIPEEYTGAPDPASARSAYHEGKRVAELQLAIYAQRTGARALIARLFAFVGPYLPLNAHFAVGNFIRDGLRGGPIVVAGDGTPLRSYQYASDLTSWLWAIFARGRSVRPYNVGGSQALDIASVANVVARAYGPDVSIRLLKEAALGIAPERYLPSTERIETELSVRCRVDFREAVDRTIAWHRGGQS